MGRRRNRQRMGTTGESGQRDREIIPEIRGKEDTGQLFLVRQDLCKDYPRNTDDDERREKRRSSKQEPDNDDQDHHERSREGRSHHSSSESRKHERHSESRRSQGKSHIINEFVPRLLHLRSIRYKSNYTVIK